MIAIVKYNAGNITSVKNAVERLGYSCIVTDDEAILKQAEKVIFPGVGEASSAMKYLKEKGLDEVIKNLTQPVLGICLGQQLLCQFSEEGNTECLGIFNATVKKFEPKLKVPHMGWNTISQLNSELYSGISADENFYFVHSFYAEISQETTAVCDYIVPFSASMQKDNFYATQFHPEKSSSVGEQLLLNFLKL
ncbi:imidazole glycerol phosphate synthase subunit HisH [Flavobacterium aquatile]|uniref:Imidazole glycerol phosphate synthase subunit HisH n=1 Tax=Flavobacterium aquatile LMG 4008 = ATCC 11947 TaxID=1453498 RepID=A0A095V241_9FLAO|nr:imidazole glycerol phosphate synthase subunit HisH [Flavobacterium aquatile]KGD68920.1 imidazole glycerol phosphate synthase [Flavobacterium aquatile LMG 4008 = ATCC 11947]OXA65633.1 imidazole glycerol phosphate synthase subunit HisH [Flavobacterium aquatile LMG 4008 = ATCC 11947]GEC79569.1 imidazole glycerol phosphate synthase subunit HisH [Flavobacterium aquatile]